MTQQNIAHQEEMSLNPSRIMKLGLSFTESRVLLSAVEFDLFTILHNNPMSVENIRARLDLHPRSHFDFLDTLLSLRLLKREGNGENSVYSNTPESQMFLSSSSPKYMGGMFKMLARRLYKFWGGLTEALQTGKPQNESKDGGDLFSSIYHSEEATLEFLNGMIAFNGPSAVILAEKFDFSKYNTLLDVGGALGQLSCEIAKKHAHMHCKTMDLKQVEQFATEYVRNEGLENRVEICSSDFFKDELMNADVITMGRILHDYDLETKKMLMKKAYDALAEQGALIVIESLIDDNRRTNTEGLIMSLTMLIETTGGFDFSGADFKEWAIDIGFDSVSIMELQYPLFAAIAKK